MVVEIRTSQDLLDLLDNNEEFRRAARRALLTDGLLELPDIVREMQQTQRLMIQQIAQVAERMDRMEERQDRMEATIASLDKRVGDMDGRLRGWELERESVRKLLPRLAREYAVRRIRAVSADSHRSAIKVNDVWEARFEEAVNEAFDAERITAAEDGLLDRTDIVARGRRIDDGSDMWFVVQASATIYDGDIERAAAGAIALRKVNGEDATAVVYGRRIAAQQRVRADELGVAVMLDDEGGDEQAAAIPTSASPVAPSDGWRPLSGFQPSKGDASPKQIMFPDNSSVAITDWRQLIVEVVRWLTDNNHLTKEHCPIHIPKAKARYIVAEQPTRPSGEPHPRMAEVNSLWVVADMRYDHVVGNTRIVIEHVGMDASQFKLRW